MSYPPFLDDDVEEEECGRSRWPSMSMRAKYGLVACVFLAFVIGSVPRTTSPLISYWSIPSPSGLTTGDLAALLVGACAVALAIDTILRPNRRIMAILIIATILVSSAYLLFSTRKTPVKLAEEEKNEPPPVSPEHKNPQTPQHDPTEIEMGRVWILADGNIIPDSVGPYTHYPPMWQDLDNGYWLYDDMLYYDLLVEADNIVIDGEGFSAKGRITLSHVTNVTLRNLNARGGISLAGVDNCVIVNNTISCSGSGISSYQADNCVIMNNVISQNHDGVYLEDVKNCVLVNNKVSDNLHYGICIDVWDIFDAWNGVQGFDNIVSGNIVSNNTFGIRYAGSDSVLAENTVKNNDYGIITYGFNLTLVENEVNNNTESEINQTEVEESIVTISREINQLYLDCEEIIATAEQQGVCTEKIRQCYSKIRDGWGWRVDLVKAKKVLDAIAWWGTNIELFISAEKALVSIKETDIHPVVLSWVENSQVRAYDSISAGDIKGAERELGAILDERKIELSSLIQKVLSAITEAEKRNKHPAIIAGMEKNFQYALSSLGQGYIERAKVYLNSILYTNQHYYEMEDLFQIAFRCISKAEKRNKHPAIIAGMKNNYEYACSSFGLGDFQRAEVYLNSILYTAGQYFGFDILELTFSSFHEVLTQIDR